MARSAALRVSTDSASIYVSVTPKRARLTPPADPMEAIEWHVRQICTLAEEYVCSTNGLCNGHPARIANHKRKLAALGIDESSLISFIHRLAPPAH